jgi:hypothetical protein
MQAGKLDRTISLERPSDAVAPSGASPSTGSPLPPFAPRSHRTRLRTSKAVTASFPAPT